MKVRNILLAGVSAVVLSGCGASDIAGPGTGGNVSIVNNPAPTPAPTAPTPTPTTALVTAANGCPTISDSQGLTDVGTLTGPTGTYRVCNLPNRINRSITLPKLAGLLYQLPGRVDVGTDGGSTVPTAAAPRNGLTADTNVTLTINPGVIVVAGTGVSWLAVNRGNRINAVGTATQPIIFTSRDNALGLNTDDSAGQWGGVVLMGRAQTTDCAASGAAPGTTSCERQTEGAIDPALYGGATNNDNSGIISYMQIRYSGYVLSANSELQALTTEGIGSQTRIDHVMSYNSSDDGAEFFGGRVNMKYYVSIGALDDNIDTDTGTKANFQYVLVAQRAGSAGAGADAMIEADTDNATAENLPRQNTIVSNFTFIDRAPNQSSDLASILLRGNTDYTLINGVLTSAPLNPCLRISQAQTASATANPAIDELGVPVFRSVLMQCATQKYIGSNGVTDAQVASIFGAGANGNSDTYTPTLTSIFINGATEAAVTPFDASVLNAASGIPSGTGGLGGQPAFFDKTSYIGAVRDASDTWYKGWVCNSSTLDFGTGNTGLCTSLPTT